MGTDVGLLLRRSRIEHAAKALCSGVDLSEAENLKADFPIKIDRFGISFYGKLGNSQHGKDFSNQPAADALAAIFLGYHDMPYLGFISGKDPQADQSSEFAVESDAIQGLAGI